MHSFTKKDTSSWNVHGRTSRRKLYDQKEEIITFFLFFFLSNLLFKFTGWVNAQLKKTGKQVKSLEKDLGDGLVLIELLEIISGEPFPSRYEKTPNHRIKKVGNVGQALKFIEVFITFSNKSY